MSDEQQLVNDLFQQVELKLKKNLADWAPTDSSSTLAAPTQISTSDQQKPTSGDITIVWCDPRIEKPNDVSRMLEKLRKINDNAYFHSDEQKCIEEIKRIPSAKFILVVSGRSASSVLSQIHDFKQLDTAFIFCAKTELYNNLSQIYNKIGGVFDDLKKLLEAVKKNVEMLLKHLEVFIFYHENEQKNSRDLSKEAAEFLWFQLFKDVILSTPHDQHSKEQLITFCRHYYRGNTRELELIEEFRKTYTTANTIRWYTRESFLYRLINQALRTENIEQLYIFRFFLNDLSKSLANLHQQQLVASTQRSVTLYRGSKMTAGELDLLQSKQGNLVSLNGYLSTSRSPDVALSFAKQSTKKANLCSVFYEIDCNTQKNKSTIFADITKESEFAGEQEVLFDIGSTFRMQSIEENKKTGVWVVKLEATDAGAREARQYIDFNKKSNEETSMAILFGNLLTEMGKYDQARKYFENLLANPKMEPDTARIYNSIGTIHLCKSELDEANSNFQRSYKMMMDTDPPREKDAARPLANMGLVLLRRKKYIKALEYLTRALFTRFEFYGEQHLETSKALNNLGNAYYEKQDYKLALIYYEKALAIQVKEFSRDHLDLARCLNNIGLVHWRMQDLANALEYHEQALEMRKNLLPREHNEIVQSLMNIGSVYRDMEELKISLSYLKQAVEMQEKIFGKINETADFRDTLAQIDALGESLAERTEEWANLPMMLAANHKNSRIRVVNLSSRRNRNNFALANNLVEHLEQTTICYATNLKGGPMNDDSTEESI